MPNAGEEIVESDIDAKKDKKETAYEAEV